MDVCLHWSPHSFVSQSGWLLLALRMPPLPSFVSRGWWCPALRMSVFTCSRRLFGCGWWCPAFRVSVFTCRPSSVSPSGWWCPALWMSMFTCLPSCVCGCLSSIGSLHLSWCGWWCPALRIVLLHLFPGLAGGVRHSGCLSSVVSLHVPPCLAGGARLSGCLSSIAPLHLPPSLAEVPGSVDVCPRLSFPQTVHCCVSLFS